MRRFRIMESSVIAEGVAFDHGMVVVHWKGRPSTTQLFRGMADLIDTATVESGNRVLAYVDGYGTLPLTAGA